MNNLWTGDLVEIAKPDKPWMYLEKNVMQRHVLGNKYWNVENVLEASYFSVLKNVPDVVFPDMKFGVQILFHCQTGH